TSQPDVRPHTGRVRRRPRLRAGPAEPLVPRAAVGADDLGRELLLPRSAGLPAGTSAAREAARADRRADRLLAGGGHGCGRAVSGRLPDRLARGGHQAFPTRGEAPVDRARVARPRAPGRARRRPDARRALGLGADAPANEAPLGTTVRSAAPGS